MTGGQARTAPQRPVLCFGEMLLRLSTPAGETPFQSPRLETCFGGAEINVAVSLARLGHPACVVTVLPDSVIGRAARSALLANGVGVDQVSFAVGRMGLYFLTPGAVSRPSEVTYDRTHSAFAQADLADFDWSDRLAGAGWLHLSGVTPATGPKGSAGALAAVRAANAAGVPVAFDGNFRGKLWQAWGGDARPILRELLDGATMAFADDRDMALILGQTFPGIGCIERLQQAAAAAFAAFPRLQTLACTLRTAHSATRHDLAAVMIKRDGSMTEQPAQKLDGIVDRIGSGDAFAAGLLFATLAGRDDQAALAFALACACLKHSIAGDFNPLSEAEVHAAMAPGADVRR